MSMIEDDDEFFYEAVARLTLFSWRQDATADESLELLRLFIEHCAMACQISRAIILYALILSKRFKSLLPDTHVPVVGSECRVFLACLISSNKYLDDGGYKNSVWSNVTGLELIEINTMEMELFSTLEFNIYASPKDLLSFRADICKQAMDDGRLGMTSMMLLALQTELDKFIMNEHEMRELPPGVVELPFIVTQSRPRKKSAPDFLPSSPFNTAKKLPQAMTLKNMQFLPTKTVSKFIFVDESGDSGITFENSGWSITKSNTIHGKSYGTLNEYEVWSDSSAVPPMPNQSIVRADNETGLNAGQRGRSRLGALLSLIKSKM